MPRDRPAISARRLPRKFVRKLVKGNTESINSGCPNSEDGRPDQFALDGPNEFGDGGGVWCEINISTGNASGNCVDEQLSETDGYTLCVFGECSVWRYGS